MASSGFGGTEVGARSPSLSRLEQFQLQVLQGYTVTYYYVVASSTLSSKRPETLSLCR